MEQVKSLTMKEYPLRERPYEKLLEFGEEYLTDAELLAIIIKTGTKNKTSLEVARNILLMKEGKGGLSNITTMSLEELTKVDGIGKIKAIQLKALSEISNRLSVKRTGNGERIVKSAKDVENLLMPKMQGYSKEVVKAVFLNTKNYIIRISDISVGSLTASIVHPREIFKEAIKCSAAAVIICHNHPSGDATPSREDIETTKRLIEAGILIGIQVLDHLVFGRDKCESIMKKIMQV